MRRVAQVSWLSYYEINKASDQGLDVRKHHLHARKPGEFQNTEHNRHSNLETRPETLNCQTPKIESVSITRTIRTREGTPTMMESVAWRCPEARASGLGYGMGI